MLEPYEPTPGIHVLPSFVPLGPMGMVPINAFLVTGEVPYLVDTGMVLDRDSFVQAVSSLVDVEELRFIYLTHSDPDHIGALHTLLAKAPRLKVITTFIASAKLELLGLPIPPHRLHLLNPGEQLEIEGRRITVAKPPIFDAPETTAFYDGDLEVLFSADSFGAPLTELKSFANDIAPEELTEKQKIWASFDSPWVHQIDRERFAKILKQFLNADPLWVMSSHLPPARGMIETLCGNVAQAPDGAPFVSPTQAEFEAMVGGPLPAEQPVIP